MKRLLYVLCMIGLVVSCKNENADAKEELTDSYVIAGTAPGLYNGIRIYLNAPDEQGRQRAIDTAVVMNEEFKFEGSTNRPEVMSISANSVMGSVPFVVENGSMEIELNKEKIMESKITGSKAQEAFNTYGEHINSANMEMRQMNTEYRKAVQAKNDSLKNRISEEMGKKNVELAGYTDTFIEENLDNPFTLLLLENSLSMQQPDLDKIEKTFDKVDQDLKNSTLGKEVKQKLDEVKKINEAFANTEVGKVAPDFTAPTPDGKMLALNDVKGKVTLIDFWAAWCGPCRRENPNVVNVYKKYHDKGLEIISVSLDGSRNQKDPKAAWLKAIEDDNLTWNHVSNLNYFNDPVARMYNIKSIPATFLLDQSGTIVAKNLRGPALEEKVSELLN